MIHATLQKLTFHEKAVSHLQYHNWLLDYKMDGYQLKITDVLGSFNKSNVNKNAEQC